MDKNKLRKSSALLIARLLQIWVYPQPWISQWNTQKLTRVNYGIDGIKGLALSDVCGDVDLQRSTVIRYLLRKEGPRMHNG